jgi:hypothetical protein
MAGCFYTCKKYNICYIIILNFGGKMTLDQIQIDFSIWEKWQNYLKKQLLPIASKIQLDTVVEQILH